VHECIKVKCIFQYNHFVQNSACQAINFGSQKLAFSMTRLSRADIFQHDEVRHKVRQHTMCLILPMVEFAFRTRPARLGPSRFALGPVSVTCTQNFVPENPQSHFKSLVIRSHALTPKQLTSLPASLTCKVCDPSVAAYYKYTVHS
jgi:hypothetical protein